MLPRMPVLANILWRVLSGSHADLAIGTSSIRRYAPGFPPMIGYADPERPDFASLAPFCDVGRRFYCAEWTGPAPMGWNIDVDTKMCAMLWKGTKPERVPSFQAVILGPEHVAQMVALAAQCKPGPYPDRPLEMGEWYGVVEGERLLAMAGERLHAGALREVSGVCTLPDFQGRGLARRLTECVIRSQLARGLTPFLHVASSNVRARTLYESMGFVVDQEVAMRVVSRTE